MNRLDHVTVFALVLFAAQKGVREGGVFVRARTAARGTGQRLGLDPSLADTHEPLG